MREPNFSEKRDCFPELENFVYNDAPEFDGKICALYGLRRTGKTIMMRQCIYEMPSEKKEETAYILCKDEADMDDFANCLDELQEKGINNFFIDEATLLWDFQRNAHVLSDYYGIQGKVVIAGTNSLNIRLAMADKLYGRVHLIQTSHVPYAEYSRLLGGKSLDEYIEYGGLLTNEPYKNNQNREEYLNTAIVSNILKSLDYARETHKYWRSLTQSYDNETLASYINKAINKFSYDVTISAVEKRYKNAALSATRNDMGVEVKNNSLDVQRVSEPSHD